jgi:hypothetical protein
LLASVKLGGGGWQTSHELYRLAAGALVSEATLGWVVFVDAGRLRPGPVVGKGALERLSFEVAAEAKPRKVTHWLEETAPWAQYVIGEELASAGVAQLVSKRFLRVFLPQAYLEILDRAAQEEVYRLVRETLLGTFPAVPEAALLVVLAGSLRYHAKMKPRHARRRFRELQASLPEDVQIVLSAYEKWRSHGAPE